MEIYKNNNDCESEATENKELEIDNIEFDTSEQKKLFETLVSRALNNEHSEQDQVLTCSDDVKDANYYLRDLRKIDKLFTEIIKKFIIDYKKHILTNTVELKTLVQLKQFILCKKFYEDEKRIIKNLKKEYFQYVFSGHIIDTLLGIPRNIDK